jgi:hypothetical protein
MIGVTIEKQGAAEDHVQREYKPLAVADEKVK